MKILSVCLAILLTGNLSYAGMNFTNLGGNRAMTAQEIKDAKKEYWKGYELPNFWNAKEAKDWAVKMPYADQWRRLLKHQLAVLEKQKEHAIDATYMQNRKWIYLAAYATMLEKRPPKEVGAYFYAGSVPVGHHP